MTEIATLDFDVMVLGYGPVGHVMAALLGQAGWRVGVVERQLGLYPLPRIGHLDHEVMRIIQAVGVADAFQQDACVCGSYDWVNGDGEVLIHFDWSKPEPSGWSPHYLFYQPDLDKLLATAVERQANIKVFRGWDCQSIAASDENVAVKCRSRDGAVKNFTTKYLIGADGANSFTRGAAGIAWIDLGFHADWLVVDYRPNDPEAKISMPEAGQICDPKRPTSLFRRIGRNHCRWEFMLLPGETREEMEEPKRIWQLLSRWVSSDDGVLVRKAVYTFRSGLAENWRKGRIFLVGDAAHLMPPFLGQGMGSGFRDALNLVWKMDLVLRGVVPSALLDTYTSERKPHVAAIIEQAVALGKIVCVSDPQVAAERDRKLLSGDVPPLPPFPILTGRLFGHGGVLLSGTLAPQGIVRHGTVEGRFDDIVGRGWYVLTFDKSIIDRLEEHCWELRNRVGLRFYHLSDSGTNDGLLIDINRHYRNFFDAHGIVALVIRPDFYIYGAAVDFPQAEDLLRIVSKAFRSFQDLAFNDIMISLTDVC